MSNATNTQLSADPEIVIVYGGVGSEREVSMVSGRAVLDAIVNDFPYPVRGVELRTHGLPEGIEKTRNLMMLVLHGEFGEDGQIQRLLEADGFHYAGCDSVCSELCMDKNRTKEAWRAHGLPVVKGTCLGAGSLHPSDAPALIERYGRELVLKPVSMGSSVGLHLISGEKDLVSFIEYKQNNAPSWILEKRIRGREFSVGVLGGRAMGVVEIEVPSARVYDFEQKYHRSDTNYHCPADLDDMQTQHLKNLAEQAFNVCGCRDYARVDFLEERETGEFYCLEINTLPGMTPQSLLPKSAGAMGYGFTDLILKMVEPAIARFLEKNRSA